MFGKRKMLLNSYCAVLLMLNQYNSLSQGKFRLLILHICLLLLLLRHYCLCNFCCKILAHLDFGALITLVVISYILVLFLLLALLVLLLVLC